MPMLVPVGSKVWKIYAHDNSYIRRAPLGIYFRELRTIETTRHWYVADDLHLYFNVAHYLMLFPTIINDEVGFIVNIAGVVSLVRQA